MGTLCLNQRDSTTKQRKKVIEEHVDNFLLKQDFFFFGFCAEVINVKLRIKEFLAAHYATGLVRVNADYKIKLLAYFNPIPPPS